ncbi:MAG: flavodoxin domain-containing protein [Halanaerobiales bacterium]|jgi:menaquinone-dependent protoporphyrinogen IX oxidase
MNTKKIIVLYKSKTGFSKKYAHWIAETLNCDIASLDKFDILDIGSYDLVIFGGGIYAGKINGINFIKMNWPLLERKKIIVFATGVTAPIPGEIEIIKKDNIPPNMDIEFFYFQSGLNYAKMSIAKKLFVKVFKSFLKAKKDKTDIEQGFLDAIENPYDYSNISQVEPLISYINGI